MDMLRGSVLWFRHGLRLHDNPALQDALQNRSIPFYPMFIFDGETAGTKLCGYNRMRYLLESLDDLDQQFRQYGGRLHMIKGKPEVVFRRLWEQLGIKKLCFERDCEPVWIPRDDSVRRSCKEVGMVIGEHVSHTLWSPEDIINANGGIPPLTYQMFIHTAATIGMPPRPVEDVDLRGINFGTLPDCFYDEFTVYDKVPKPEDLGVMLENEDIRMIRWVGGETHALNNMKKRLAVELETFKRFYWDVQDLFRQVHGDRLPTSQFITGQLIWREYFYTMSVNNPNFARMSNNPICLDIPWRAARDDELLRWKEGRTGFPFIDAAMRQLRTEGWLHHAVRNAVASFLTRGCLWLSWELGVQHFLKYLLDADWSVCTGNWLWVSSSAFEALLDSGECACPVLLGKRLDPSGQYVRRYVQELQGLPINYIYEPWRAPIDVQEQANCVIGKDYPLPMVNHLTSTQNNRTAMKELRDFYQKAPPLHCCPSSDDEIRQFMWLPDETVNQQVIASIESQSQ